MSLASAISLDAKQWQFIAECMGDELAAAKQACKQEDYTLEDLWRRDTLEAFSAQIARILEQARNS